MKTTTVILILLPSFALAQMKPKTQFGTQTTLQGYLDVQSYGNPCQNIRANPVTGTLHVTFHVADDSTDISASTRTAYAYSLYFGFGWDNCNEIRLPHRKSGTPSLDMFLAGPNQSPVVANHNVQGTLLQPGVFVDTPYASCTFPEVTLPPSHDTLINPDVACGAGNTILVVAQRSSDGVLLFAKLSDTTWTIVPGGPVTTYTAHADQVTRIGIVLSRPDGSVHLYESTDNGLTWPLATSEIVPASIIASQDTFGTFLGADFTYLNGNPIVAVTVSKRAGSGFTHREASIAFWSATTGLRIAVARSAIPGTADTLRTPQALHLTVGYPSIGTSEGTIVIAFQAFTTDTSTLGFNYSAIFTTYSADGGITWSQPYRLDWFGEDGRYPSVAKLNAPGQPFLVWQQDEVPGSHVLDGAPLSLARQAFFYFVDLHVPSIVGVPDRLALYQNYPNPFNPRTTIHFTIPHLQFTSLKVYNILGQEVAALVNEVKPAGRYEVAWDASGFSSGIYFYRLQTSEFSETKKLIVLK